MDYSFVAIDVETAIGKRWSICQIGLTIIEENEIVQTISEYVQPPDNEYHFMNINVHKITPDITKNKPFFPEIWNKIYPLIKDKKLVAHNASFDKSCLNQALNYYDMDVPSFDFDCTLKMSGEKLHSACETWGISLKNHHDASCDATACALLYLKLKDNYHSLSTITIITNKNQTTRKPYSKTHSYSSINNLNVSSKLKGLSIIASGKLEHFSREEIKQVIEDNGGKAVSSISKNTSYLLAGENIGPNKLEKATKLGIPIITEEEFMKMLE